MAVYVAIPLSFILFVIKILNGNIDIGLIAPMVFSALIVFLFVMGFGYAGIFGGADSIAMGVIALTSFHFGKSLYTDEGMYFTFIFLGWFIIVSLMIYGNVIVKNIITRDMFELPDDNRIIAMFATKIPVEKFKYYRGTVMEWFDEDGNKIFLPITKSTFNNEQYITTTIYEQNIELYEKDEEVWVSFLLPFIIPITIAYCLAIATVVIV